MRTSFNIPDDLLSEFDETWQAEGLDSRSRGVREAMQEYIEGHTTLEDIEGDVVVTSHSITNTKRSLKTSTTCNTGFRISSRPQITFTRESGVSRRSSVAGQHRASETSRIAYAILMR